MTNIVLKNSTNKITLKRTSPKIVLKHPVHKISIKRQGFGPAGQDGADGQDGQDGQDGEDDKTYEATLTNQTSVTITHNLGKYPAITVFNSAGDEVEGEYKHLNTNSTLLTFSAGFSGKAIFN